MLGLHKTEWSNLTGKYWFNIVKKNIDKFYLLNFNLCIDHLRKFFISNSQENIDNFYLLNFNLHINYLRIIFVIIFNY